MRKILMIIMTAIVVHFFCIDASAEELSEIPEDVQQICEDAGKEFSVCPTILMSLIYTESRGIISDNLTQITSVRWFKEGMEACGVDEIKTPENNIRVCAYYIAKWCEQYEDIYLAVDCWRYGPENAVARFSDSPSRYSRTIVERSAEWEEEWYQKRRGDTTTANPRRDTQNHHEDDSVF